MTADHDETRTSHDSRLVSPELVLVDPELASRERERLPSPGQWDAVARIRALERRHLETAPADPVEETGRRARRRRRWAVPVAAASALVITLVLADVRLQVGRTPASAGPAAVEEPERLPTASLPQQPPQPQEPPQPQAPRPDATPRPKRNDARSATPPPAARPAAPARAKPQRFAWAPSPGASGYRFELFHGGVRIFVAETTRPAAVVPASWTFRNRAWELAPGDYIWFVWPIVQGRRQAAAIVQSRLTVTGR